MKSIIIHVDGSVAFAEETGTELFQQYIDSGLISVLPSERLGTWWDNVGFLGSIHSREAGADRNEAATRLNVAKEYRKVNAMYGPTFVIGIDGRTPVDLPDEVTVEEIHRLIDLYEDH